ncbi:MAG TPA: CPBP family intramembrane glutamic endopeptidase [Terriglobales bacterium]|nr:CPBP family intramembrane glutamic endopeptidase [Terriglobales bacterium]
MEAGETRLPPAAEGLLLLAITLPLALAFNFPTLWLLMPLALLAVTARPYEPYGLEWGRYGSWRFHLVVCTAVFVPYCIGHYLSAYWWQGADFTLRVPPQFPRQIIEQFLLIALPEEMFFRGYLQSQFDRSWGTRWKVLDAQVGPGWLAANVLFAFCHIFRGGPARLIVFFPGLLYGWLRARTGSIAAPVTYHAVSNLLMQVMLESLIPHAV